MTPPSDRDTGPRTIPSIGSALRSLASGRERPVKLLGEIGGLEVTNCWGRPYITEKKLYDLMTLDAVKLWLKQFIKEEGNISLPDQIYLKPAYIFEKLRKTLAILILSGKERAIVHFCRQRAGDDKLPISQEDLIPDLKSSSFFLNQFKFIIPKMSDEMPASLSQNYILPILQRKFIGDGSFSEVYKIQIDKDQDDISHTSTDSVGSQKTLNTLAVTNTFHPCLDLVRLQGGGNHR
jgi:hypothetical protein